MLGLVTGVPGAKKTVFVVSKLDKTESENKVNLVKNIAYYQHNQKIINDHDLKNQMTYYYEDVGSGHLLKQEMTILPDDYFDMLSVEYDDLRPDDYYKVATIYNSIISRIVETENITGFKYLLPVRTIYANINALKIDFVRSLYDLLDDREYIDWRKAPDGSIIVIDEVQLVEPYKQSKNKDEVREMASLTKMMTALVSLELAQEMRLDIRSTYFKVSIKAATTIGTTANLVDGQVLSIWDLLHGLMLPSGNDAAMVLAENFSERLMKL